MAFFALIAGSLAALKDPKAVWQRLYHELILPGGQALKDPVGVGQSLRANYALDLHLFFAMHVYWGIVGCIIELLLGKGVLAFVLGITIGLVLRLAGLWFVIPWIDRFAYRIFGLQISYERSREAMFASLLPYVSPILLGGFLIAIVVAVVVPPLSFLALPLLIWGLVQGIRTRKHLLGCTTLQAAAPLLFWTIIVIVLVVLGIVVGIGAAVGAAAVAS